MSEALRRTLRIDARHRSLDEVLAQLARDLALPDWFGHNLDALYDMLTTEVEGPLCILWRIDRSVRARLGPDYRRLRRTLLDAAAARDDLEVVIEEVD